MTAAVTIGLATLYLGDAYEIRPTLGWFDADVFDPPYEFKASGGGPYRDRRSTMDEIVEQNLCEGFDVTVINPLLCGAVVVFVCDDQLGCTIAHLDGLFHRRALCVLRKVNPQPLANQHYRPECEFYCHAWARGFAPTGTMKDKLRVTDTYSPRGPQKYGHPTTKPDLVMDKIMRNVAGNSVCDPFMGTGSTGVAAVKAGKRFVGIEHNPVHFETAIGRLIEAQDGPVAVAA